jgi:hypothetical protein
MTSTSTSSKFNTDSERRNVVRYGYDDAYGSTSAGRKVEDIRDKYMSRLTPSSKLKRAPRSSYLRNLVTIHLIVFLMDLILV